jgi:hypothetical protein
MPSFANWYLRRSKVQVRGGSIKQNERFEKSQKLKDRSEKFKNQ